MVQQMHLRATEPFSLQSTVRSHGWWQMSPFGWDEEAEMLYYTDELTTGKVVGLTMQADVGSIQVSVMPDVSPSEAEEIEERVRWMLGLDQDFSEFYGKAEQEPELAYAVEEARGRILRSSTLFEDVIKTILTTNTLWAATRRMNANLVDLFGRALDGDPGRRAFPTANAIASSDEATLREKARLGYRAPYVLELAQAVASGSLDLESLKDSTLSTPELRKELLKIKGVGDYAAANLLMLLGRYEHIPVDTWALGQVSKEWYEGEPVGRKEVLEAFERWGRWKGLVYWLWGWSD